MKKLSLSGLTFGHKRSCDSITGGLVFANLVSIYPLDFKEKRNEAAWLNARPFGVNVNIYMYLEGGLLAPTPQCN